ncbi:hypothetical protein AJ80_01544 [Polytolypa hystricis UAMH7299]|uniref:Uncharacterized protein n=1 Tax=Polytolypa hystricis (strain UAMH7299) TaxID=1447883 RepID=A0A2B7Z0L3_POLH7|nr:hypothetical protein AJ80_01544 [Polytolypa hystricis UAMH7299]
MDAEEYSSRLELARQYNIHFLGPVQADRWPRTQGRLFRDVQSLGEKKYAGFCQSASIDSIDKPWRGQTKHRAQQLAANCERRFKEYRNEAGWRLHIEPDVFYRFTVEVACPKCRARLWRSEIEAAIDGTDTHVKSLEERRKERSPCSCTRSWDHPEDPGINELFSDRAEADIKHDPPLPVRKSTLKKKEKPDRVYGLRQTENFRTLLDSADKRVPMDSNVRRLRDTLTVSPFEHEPEPLLFPFLIVEAKTGKTATQATVQMQTAFCIRRLLTLQYDLKTAPEKEYNNESAWETGPLVWFLSWYGELWRLSACFVETINGPVPHFTVVDLWGGDIRCKDEALQLLLIVDYIFDWARDIYRPAVLTELDALSTGYIPAVDPDIFSTMERSASVPTRYSQQSQSHLTFAAVDSGPIIDPNLPGSSHPDGTIRDAAILESRFLVLCITERDVENFLLSFPSVEQSTEAVLTMMVSLHQAWCMTADTLNSVEVQWTGEFRPHDQDYDPDEKFYVNFVLLMFLSPEWEPVRQLTCLAVSKAAWRTLLAKTTILNATETVIMDRLQSCPPVGKVEIGTFLSRLKEQSIMNNLTAAVSMLCLSSSFYKRGKIPRELLLCRFNGYHVGFRINNSPSVLDLVTIVYEAHKIGRREPADPYVRLSRIQTKQTVHINRFHMWPRRKLLLLHISGCILIDGSGYENSPKRCIYVVKASYPPDDAPGLARALCREGRYYSTTQLGPGLRPRDYFSSLNGSTEATTSWRTECNPETFEDWMEHLEAQLQNRAGMTASSPIPITSSEESSEEGDEDSDELMLDTD